MTTNSKSASSTRSLSARANPMRPVPYLVVSNERETRDTVTLSLTPTSEQPPHAPLIKRPDPAPAEAQTPREAPGQFNMLWAWGLGEAPISFSAIPASGQLVHTIRDVGVVTHQLCGLQPGAAVGVRGPFGVGWPIEPTRGQDVVLIAGGIGLAPLRPVVHAILAERSEFGRVTLIVGARRIHDQIFRDELNDWRLDRRIKVRATVDHPCSHWKGSIGIVTQELRRVLVDGSNTVAMVCGPEVMMRFVAAGLVGLGVSPDRIAVSMERNMRCGIGLCGHCQLGGAFICIDGPVFSWREARPLMAVREL